MDDFVIIVIITAFFAVWIVVSLIAAYKFKGTPVFKSPRGVAAFWALSLTWGLPSTVVGAVVSLVLVLLGKRPKKYGHCVCFELEKTGWGVSLGPVIIVPSDDDGYMKRHEHGHAIQNVYFGFFMPFIVSAPSSVRFWARKLKKHNKTEYDDVWFERSATESGKAFMDSFL